MEHRLDMRAATDEDYGYIAERDRHVARTLIPAKIREREIYIIRSGVSGAEAGPNDRIGWLRYGYFWDNTPFMNLLWLDEPHRGRGIGRLAVTSWEEEMAGRGFGTVMTSTQANEEAQHFYRKLGYRDAGCLLQEDEPLEIILVKKTGRNESAS